MSLILPKHHKWRSAVLTEQEFISAMTGKLSRSNSVDKRQRYAKRIQAAKARIAYAVLAKSP